MNSWVQENYKKLLVAAFGVSACVSIGSYAFSQFFKTPEKKVGTKDIAEHFASRIKKKYSQELEESQKADFDMAAFCHSVRESCSPELEKLEQEYQEQLEKIHKKEVTQETLRHYHEYIAKTEAIVQEAKKRLSKEKGYNEEEVDRRLRELEASELLLNIEYTQVPTVISDKDLFKTVLREFVEISDRLKQDNPEMPLELIRQQSSEEIQDKRRVTVEHLEAGIHTHKAQRDPELESVVNKFNALKPSIRTNLTSMVKALAFNKKGQ